MTNNAGQHCEVEVLHSIPLRRTDRQKDRVEVAPEQLVAAQQEAEGCPRHQQLVGGSWGLSESLAALNREQFTSVVTAPRPSRITYPIAPTEQRLTLALGTPTTPVRVVGWYHSHPHITCTPSHVDVRTQGQYQAMDDGFVGLIFSAFVDDQGPQQDLRGQSGELQCMAFQAQNMRTDGGGPPVVVRMILWSAHRWKTGGAAVQCSEPF